MSEFDLPDQIEYLQADLEHESICLSAIQVFLDAVDRSEEAFSFQQSVLAALVGFGLGVALGQSLLLLTAMFILVLPFLHRANKMAKQTRKQRNLATLALLNTLTPTTDALHELDQARGSPWFGEKH